MRIKPVCGKPVQGGEGVTLATQGINITGQFKKPDWDKAIDVEQVLQKVPADANVRGIFFRTAIQEMQKTNLSLPENFDYAPFLTYPVKDLIHVLVAACEIVYPGISLRKGLRMLGHKVFGNIAATKAGGMLLKMAGGNLSLAVGLTGRFYQLLSSGGTASVLKIDDHRAIISLRNTWIFPDAYHVGIFEGAIREFGKHGVVMVRQLSMSDVDLKLEYT